VDFWFDDYRLNIVLLNRVQDWRNFRKSKNGEGCIQFSLVKIECHLILLNENYGGGMGIQFKPILDMNSNGIYTISQDAGNFLYRIITNQDSVVRLAVLNRNKGNICNKTDKFLYLFHESLRISGFGTGHFPHQIFDQRPGMPGKI